MNKHELAVYFQLGKKLKLINILINTILILLFSFNSFEPLSAQPRDTLAGTVSLAGRVLEESGQPSKDLVQVDLVCNGRIRQQTITASDGTFQFDMDPSRDESWLDPSAGGSTSGTIEGPIKTVKSGGSTALDQVPEVGRGMVSLTGCEVKLSPRPGMNSNSINLRTRNSFENPDIGVIVIHRLSDEGATTISLTSLNAPKKATSAFDKANNALLAKKPDLKKAIKELNKAVKEYPQYSAAWDLLARVHLSQGDKTEGRNCFLRAVEEEPKFITPYLGIAQLAFQDSNWTETFDWTEKILALDEANFQALYWNGLSAFYLQKFDESEKSLSNLFQKVQPQSFPFGLFPLGVIHANQGKMQNAAEELNLYLELMPPDRVPEGQRRELEAQIAIWQSEGLVTLPVEEEGEQENP